MIKNLPKILISLGVAPLTLLFRPWAPSPRLRQSCTLSPISKLNHYLPSPSCACLYPPKLSCQTCSLALEPESGCKTVHTATWRMWRWPPACRAIKEKKTTQSNIMQQGRWDKERRVNRVFQYEQNTTCFSSPIPQNSWIILFFQTTPPEIPGMENFISNNSNLATIRAIENRCTNTVNGTILPAVEVGAAPPAIYAP